MVAFVVASEANAANPETICGIANVKKGAEEQFRALEQDSWSTYLGLGLVQPDLHVLLQGVEHGENPFFLVIFTWKSAEIPENAPKAVQDVWAKMRALCESRDGHPPIEISEMRIIEPRTGE